LATERKVFTPSTNNRELCQKIKGDASRPAHLVSSLSLPVCVCVCVNNTRLLKVLLLVCVCATSKQCRILRDHRTTKGSTSCWMPSKRNSKT
jgi:hypothetical protein